MRIYWIAFHPIWVHNFNNSLRDRNWSQLKLAFFKTIIFSDYRSANHFSSNFWHFWKWIKNQIFGNYLESCYWISMIFKCIVKFNILNNFFYWFLKPKTFLVFEIFAKSSRHYMANSAYTYYVCNCDTVISIAGTFTVSFAVSFAVWRSVYIHQLWIFLCLYHTLQTSIIQNCTCGITGNVFKNLFWQQHDFRSRVIQFFDIIVEMIWKLVQT